MPRLVVPWRPVTRKFDGAFGTDLLHFLVAIFITGIIRNTPYESVSLRSDGIILVI